MADDNDKPTITRRRALGGLATIGAAGALGAGSWAAFSDTEDDIEAMMTAGAIDGTVGVTASYNGNQVDSGGDYDGIANMYDIGDDVELELTDLKPGDYGSVTFTITNNGNKAWVASCLGYDSKEKGRNDPEKEADSDGASNMGELQNHLLLVPFYSNDGQNLFFNANQNDLGNPDSDWDGSMADYGSGTSEAFWNSTQGTNDFDEIRPQTLANATTVGSTTTICWNEDSKDMEHEAPEGSSADPGCILLDGNLAGSPKSDTYNDAQEVSPLLNGETLNFGYDWHLPYTTGNVVQTDSVTMKFAHNFYQVRHADGVHARNDYAPENTEYDNDSQTATTS